MFEPCITDSTKLLNTSLTVAVDATETADNMTPQPAIKGVMTGGAAPALSNINSLAINSTDSFILGEMTGLVFQMSGDRSIGNVSTGSPLSQVVEKALDSAKDILTGLSVDANLTDKLNLAFGENWNREAAANLIRDFATSDFSKLPEIEILTSTQMNGANGAFAAATDKIYLSQEFIAKNAGNADAIKSVILEETGHFIDSRINTKDAAGDEGEIFADVVHGKTFDAAGLATLKAEDDSTTLNLDGQKYLAEMNSFVIQGSIGTYYYRSDNSILRSLLGAPTSNEFQVTNGWRQNFQNGSIFHSSRGTFVARGSVGDYYLKLGGEKSQLGLPTSNEFQVTNGWRQNFQNGAIFHSGAGSYTVRGSVGNYYLNNLGGEKSQLGLPTSNEFQVTNGWRQNFQNGAIFHSGAGSYTIRGSLGNYYLNNLGGEKSQLGLPISNEFSTAYGARQNFERGYVDWWNTGKGTFTLNSSPTPTPTPAPGNPDIDIQLFYPTGGFTNTEMTQIEKAAQNWERIITKDKSSKGVLKISIVKSQTDNLNWYADSYTDNARNFRTNFNGADVDINGVDYDNNIRFNPSKFSQVVNGNQLVQLAMHEIGHTLGLDHETSVSLMNHSTFNRQMTNTMWNSLTNLGYSVDRNAAINWT